MNMIPSSFRRPAYHEQFGTGAVRDVARASLPPISLSQDGLPAINYSPPSSIVRGPSMIPRPPVNMPSQNGMPAMNYSPPSVIQKLSGGGMGHETLPFRSPQEGYLWRKKHGLLGSQDPYEPALVNSDIEKGHASRMQQIRDRRGITPTPVAWPEPGSGSMQGRLTQPVQIQHDMTLPDRGHSQAVNINSATTNFSGPNDTIDDIYQRMTPEERAIIDQRRAIDQGLNERFDAVLDDHNYRQGAVRDMRRVVGGVPGAQTPQGYAAPLSNNGSQVADYTGSMGAFRTDEQRRADRDMANQAMRWQANREADMMSGDLRQRMQRAYGGGDIPVGPPQVRTDGTVMVGNRFMEVPSNMIPVNNSMASYQQQEGGYSERVQQRAKERLVAQGFKTDEEQDQEMARRRASYMDDVNGNSERSRQMRRAERMGLIPRGTATPVRASAESGNMIPSARQGRVSTIADSAEPGAAVDRKLPGLDQRVSDTVRIFDEQEDTSPEAVREIIKQSGGSVYDAVQDAIQAAVRAKEGEDYPELPDSAFGRDNKVINEQTRQAAQKTADAIFGILSDEERKAAEKEVEKEIQKKKKSRKNEIDSYWWNRDPYSQMPPGGGWQ